VIRTVPKPAIHTFERGHRGEVTDFGWIGGGNWKARGSRILGAHDRRCGAVERCGGLWLAGLFGGCLEESILLRRGSCRYFGDRPDNEIAMRAPQEVLVFRGMGRGHGSQLHQLAAPLAFRSLGHTASFGP
jgi:hypothetical protein